MILSVCSCMPSLMALTQTGTEKYHQVSEVYHKVSEAKKYRSNPFMGGDGKMTLSICKYVPQELWP